MCCLLLSLSRNISHLLLQDRTTLYDTVQQEVYSLFLFVRPKFSLENKWQSNTVSELFFIKKEIKKVNVNASLFQCINKKKLQQLKATATYHKQMAFGLWLVQITLLSKSGKMFDLLRKCHNLNLICFVFSLFSFFLNSILFFSYISTGCSSFCF